MQQRASGLGVDRRGVVGVSWVLLSVMGCHPATDATRRDPAIELPSTPTAMATADAPATCTGRQAAQVFDHAVCACTNLALAGILRTDALDSRTAGTPAGIGGAVGVNGALQTAGSGNEIGWTLTVAGAQGLSFAGGYTIRGDLAVAGAVRGASTGVRVMRDARIGGDLTLVPGMRVERDLYQPQGALRFGQIDVGGAVHPGPVAIDAPCACEPAQLLDIAALVREASAHNDDTAGGVDPSALAGQAGRTTLEIPAGRHYLDAIRAAGELTLRVTGRSALFVGGDISLAGALHVDLAADAELDLYVAGSLHAAGVLRLGGIARPAAVRVYVAGGEQIAFAGGTSLVGHLYAPQADLRFAGTAEVWGSVFTRSVAAAGGLMVHYDRAVADAGADCPAPPPEQCTSCGGCAQGQACVGGACGRCTRDADCCSGKTCDAATGACVAPMSPPSSQPPPSSQCASGRAACGASGQAACPANFWCSQGCCTPVPG